MVQWETNAEGRKGRNEPQGKNTADQSTKPRLRGSTHHRHTGSGGLSRERTYGRARGQGRRQDDEKKHRLEMSGPDAEVAGNHREWGVPGATSALSSRTTKVGEAP